VSIDFADDIVRACCVFHNFGREKDRYNCDRTLYAEGQVDTPNAVPQQAGRSANYVRNHFANCFVSSEGEAHWQYDKVWRNLREQRTFGLPLTCIPTDWSCYVQLCERPVLIELFNHLN
jgi:hypothetical protein